jgi:hypothetical protein
MARLLGLIGILVFLAGLDLLWQSRREVAFWFTSDMKMFRSKLRVPGLRRRPLEPQVEPIKHQRRLPMVLGMGLALAGPVMIAVSLTLLLFAGE